MTQKEKKIKTFGDIPVGSIPEHDVSKDPPAPIDPISEEQKMKFFRKFFEREGVGYLAPAFTLRAFAHKCMAEAARIEALQEVRDYREATRDANERHSKLLKLRDDRLALWTMGDKEQTKEFRTVVNRKIEELKKRHVNADDAKKIAEKNVRDDFKKMIEADLASLYPKDVQDYQDSLALAGFAKEAALPFIEKADKLGSNARKCFAKADELDPLGKKRDNAASPVSA